jgi:hypothetical protein
MGGGLANFSCNIADHIELSLIASFDGNLLTARSRWGVDGMISDISHRWQQLEYHLHLWAQVPIGTLDSITTFRCCFLNQNKNP